MTRVSDSPLFHERTLQTTENIRSARESKYCENPDNAWYHVNIRL